jgi:hypothetical protein
MLAVALAAGALVGGAVAAAPPSYTPCHAPYAGPLSTAFETPCFDSLFVDEARGLQVRRYAAPHARAIQDVRANLTGEVTFAEAALNGAAFVFCYLEGACSTAHANHYASRTVPLTVRPPRAGDGPAGAGWWRVEMALAPSQWPGAAPAGENDIAVVPRATALVASKHCVAAAPPGPDEADFRACLSLLEGDDAGKLAAAGFDVDSRGAYTPTFAYFTGQNETDPKLLDFEVWVSVRAV